MIVHCSFGRSAPPAHYRGRRYSLLHAAQPMPIYLHLCEGWQSGFETRRRCRLLKLISNFVCRSVEEAMMENRGVFLWTYWRDTRVRISSYLLGLIGVCSHVIRHAPMPPGTLRIRIVGWHDFSLHWAGRGLACWLLASIALQSDVIPGANTGQKFKQRSSSYVSGSRAPLFSAKSFRSQSLRWASSRACTTSG